MEVIEKKIDCRFVVNDQEFEGLLHLIEVRYSERIVFWNGVLQLTRDQMLRFGEPPNHPVTVTLSDDRVGGLYFTHGTARSGDYFELAGVGKPN